ncbi:hypothetical protein K8I61_17305 [bacterium]|nr:hypothetical protein [bacterium]
MAVELNELETQALSREEDEQLMETVAEAYEQEDFETVAEIIAVPFAKVVKQREITSLLLNKDVRDDGDRTVVVTTDDLVAYVSDLKGHAKQVDIVENEVPVFFQRIFTNPMFDVRTFRKGRIGDLAKIMMRAGEIVAEKRDKRTIDVIRASIQPGFTVDISSGSVFTKAAFKSATSIGEDIGLPLKYILMRGGRNQDVEGFAGLADPVAADLQTRGVQSITFSGGNFVNSVHCEDTEAFFFFDTQIGDYVLEKEDQVEIEQPQKFKQGVLAFEESGVAIYNPKVVRVRITT